jgi:hypothetical protein
MTILTNPMLVLWSHSAFRALIATYSKIGSPVNLDRAPNSTMKVPTPAVHVMVVSPLGTPLRKLTVPYGIPVVVLKAENKGIG